MTLDLQQRVRTFLAERFLFDPQAMIDPAESLMAKGILDSTGVIELVMFLEETFGIRIADDEMLAANLDTIDSITRFVSSKSRERHAA